MNRVQQFQSDDVYAPVQRAYGCIKCFGHHRRQTTLHSIQRNLQLLTPFLCVLGSPLVLLHRLRRCPLGRRCCCTIDALSQFFQLLLQFHGMLLPFCCLHAVSHSVLRHLTAALDALLDRPKRAQHACPLCSGQKRMDIVQVARLQTGSLHAPGHCSARAHGWHCAQDVHANMTPDEPKWCLMNTLTC